jgi:hypothetical protein
MSVTDRPNLDALEPVLAELRGRPSMHITEVVAALLRVCRGEETFLGRHKFSHTYFTPVGDFEAMLAREFVEHGIERWSTARLAAFADRLVDACGRLPPALVALSAARWLETTHRSLFIHYFRDCDREVAPGEPWPIAESPASHYRPRSIGNPEHRGRAGDRGEWLTLVPPSTAGLKIHLRWVGPWLSPMVRGRKVAIGVVSHDPHEFDFDPITPGGAPRFYGLRPRAPDYWARIDAVVSHAHDAGADVLVLPELCLTEELHARLIADPRLAAFALVLAGSRHTARVGDEPGRNVATLLAHGKVIAEHAKLSDFFLPRTMPPCYEHIRPGEGIVVLVSERASAVVLICKDAMRADWQDLVAHLAPRLLLIPSMSNEHGDFHTFAERMARDPQAHTFFANIGPEQAILGRPSREDPVIINSREVGRCIIYEIGRGVMGERYPLPRPAAS